MNMVDSKTTNVGNNNLSHKEDRRCGTKRTFFWVLALLIGLVMTLNTYAACSPASLNITAEGFDEDDEIYSVQVGGELKLTANVTPQLPQEPATGIDNKANYTWTPTDDSNIPDSVDNSDATLGYDEAIFKSTEPGLYTVGAKFDGGYGYKTDSKTIRVCNVKITKVPDYLFASATYYTPIKFKIDAPAGVTYTKSNITKATVKFTYFKPKVTGPGENLQVDMEYVDAPTYVTTLIADTSVLNSLSANEFECWKRPIDC